MGKFLFEIAFSFLMPQVLDRMGAKEIMEQLLKQVRYCVIAINYYNYRAIYLLILGGATVPCSGLPESRQGSIER